MPEGGILALSESTVLIIDIQIIIFMKVIAYQYIRPGIIIKIRYSDPKP